MEHYLDREQFHARYFLSTNIVAQEARNVSFDSLHIQQLMSNFKQKTYDKTLQQGLNIN